jgi:hypothetical protein
MIRLTEPWPVKCDANISLLRYRLRTQLPRPVDMIRANCTIVGVDCLEAQAKTCSGLYLSEAIRLAAHSRSHAEPFNTLLSYKSTGNQNSTPLGVLDCGPIYN